MALTDYVIMPREDYQAICDATRTKTGKTDVLKSGDLASEISSITGGGGTGDATVYWVTFMNGGTELFRMPVLAGDDCKNPITTGDITTPAKDSTAQYNYTYSGWSATADGTADSTILQAVTEDKTVYAVYTSTVRKYSINFYDGETLLTTLQVAYGDTPVYTTEKDGYNFEGWSPEIVAVTGDTNYYAQWSTALTFAGASWADIARISEAGEAASTFKVGDTRNEIIGDKTVTLEIIGFNHDDLADGTGKAGITIWCKTPYTSVAVSQTNAGNSAHPWLTGVLHTAEESMFDDFSTDLQAVVKTVNKQYLETSRWNANILTGSARVWSLAPVGEMNYSDGNHVAIGSVYEKFAPISKPLGSSSNYNDVITGSDYWLRGVYNTMPTYISSAGKLSMHSTNTSISKYICPCFCV